MAVAERTDGIWGEVARGTRRVVDVRSRAAYEAGHVAGSVWIPAGEVPARLYELPATSTPLVVVHATREEAAAVVATLGARCKWVAEPVAYPELLGDPAIATATGFDGTERLWAPTPVLVEWIERLEGMLGGPGSMLDVGCGHGRDMAYLTARGWRVAGIDNRKVLLDHSVHLCARYGGSYAGTHVPGVHAVDLRREFPATPRSVDLVVVVRFLLRDALAKIRESVRPGGFVLYSHFLEGCHEVGPCNPKTPSHYFTRGELEQIFNADEFDVVVSKESKLPDERPIIDFIARRKLAAAGPATPAGPPASDGDGDAGPVVGDDPASVGEDATRAAVAGARALTSPTTRKRKFEET